MASTDQTNPLISMQKSDSDLHVVLHPLVLLTISDYITRHTLRQQTCPIVGAILGQQNGREITMEHAFEILAQTSPTGDISMDSPWFTDRLDQMKTVHKDRGLDLVGWYTLVPCGGPQQGHLNLHNQILSLNESAALLAFHPDEVLVGPVGGKLPLTIYETVQESDEHTRKQTVDGEEDKEMADSGQQRAPAALQLRFRELPYSVETSEVEMISMDFVARGGANATAVGETQHTADEIGSRKKPVVSSVTVDIKGKRRAVAKEEEEPEVEPVVLSREDEELVSTLTAKANAIKMLSARIQLIIKYLEGLPPSYLSGETSGSEDDLTGGTTTPSSVILRSIQALVNRIPLLVPSSTEAFQQEMLSETNDVQLISLLNDVIQSVGELRDIGRKFQATENVKSRRGGHPGMVPDGSQVHSVGVSAGDIHLLS